MFVPAYTSVTARSGFSQGPPPPPPPHMMPPGMAPGMPLMHQAQPFLQQQQQHHHQQQQQKQQAARTQFSDAVRSYVQRAFAESNAVEGVNRVDIEAKLKQVISQAAEQKQLDHIDWQNRPLPQHMIVAERMAAAQPPVFPRLAALNLQHTTNISSPESPRKRKSGEFAVDNDQQTSSVPPWRQSGTGHTRTLDSRISQPNKRQKNGRDSSQQLQTSQAELDKAKRQQRFQNQADGKTVGNRELDPEHITLGPVVGRCQTLEKKYLRLTAAPNPEFVRPLEVLRKTLELLKTRWRQEGNYNYICDQFKSLRQDLTVQHIKSEFTVNVYEIHARIALEKGDLGEYNQCQSQLRALYAENLGGHPVEFQAYRILYFLYTCNRTELSDLLATLTPAEKKEPAIQHALNARSALALGNYHRFFRLYLETPNMGAYLMDMFIQRERLVALANMCKAYKPDIGLRFVTEELGFESDADAAKFICEHGGQGFLEERSDKVRFLTGKVGNHFDLLQKEAFKKVDLKGQL